MGRAPRTGDLLVVKINRLSSGRKFGTLSRRRRCKQLVGARTRSSSFRSLSCRDGGGRRRLFNSESAHGRGKVILSRLRGQSLRLTPALALVSFVIVLMSFGFRLGNHFDLSGRDPKDLGAIQGNEPDRAYVPRKSGIKSRLRQSEASHGATATFAMGLVRKSVRWHQELESCRHFECRWG